MKSILDIGNNLGIALRDYADSNRKSELSTIACHGWNSNWQFVITQQVIDNFEILNRKPLKSFES